MDYNLNRIRGYVLVMTMLFLLVLSFLAIRILNIGVLESKVGVSQQNKINSFYLAESYLLQAERQIITGINVTAAKVELITSDICGVKFYRITATASYHGVKSTLQSSFAKVDDLVGCDKKLNIVSGRQSFLVIQ